MALAGEAFDELEGLENRAGVRLAAAEVVDLAAARVLDELVHEARHVAAVNVVAHLFALVAEDPVFAAFEVALRQGS